MPSYIVKVERDLDLYVLWSTVTDCPHEWGTRADLESSHDYEGGAGPSRWAPERFERADATGTSSHDGFFGWDDDEFIVYNMGPTPGRLKRTDLKQFLDSIKGEDDFDFSLLTPFEDDE